MRIPIGNSCREIAAQSPLFFYLGGIVALTLADGHSCCGMARRRIIRMDTGDWSRFDAAVHQPVGRLVRELVRHPFVDAAPVAAPGFFQRHSRGARDAGGGAHDAGHGARRRESAGSPGGPLSGQSRRKCLLRVADRFSRCAAGTHCRTTTNCWSAPREGIETLNQKYRSDRPAIFYSPSSSAALE